MGDEASNRSVGTSDAGDGAAGGAGEQSPLRSRASFLKNWSWESLISLNERTCRRGGAEPGQNPQTYRDAESEWRQHHQTERTLLETLDWLRAFHRQAPFLYFNGNTFADVARTLVDTLFADLPASRRRESASLAAHYVAGVLDQESMISGLETLLQAADFHVGDRVRTAKGSTQGVVKRVLSDGRIVWLPNRGRRELLALPESLQRDSKDNRGGRES